MKYRIEKDTVRETLVIPLYERKVCTQLYPNLYEDETATRLMEQIDYDFSRLENKQNTLCIASDFWKSQMRQNDLAWDVKDYLKTHLKAAVVNLG